VRSTDCGRRDGGGDNNEERVGGELAVVACAARTIVGVTAAAAAAAGAVDAEVLEKVVAVGQTESTAMVASVLGLTGSGCGCVEAEGLPHLIRPNNLPDSRRVRDEMEKDAGCSGWVAAIGVVVAKAVAGVVSVAGSSDANASGAGTGVAGLGDDTADRNGEKNDFRRAQGLLEADGAAWSSCWRTLRT
jgi:hypothetical protein